ncbi:MULTISPECIES: proton extrusion protein PcxA [Pseudanabaena]|uniref:proton extrusion protein PcxA n=1 Tax=Pseudanabaena TaxID=1152 RepID=UPI00247A0293|nr:MULTISPECIES: proton extrusion protein PcxA [Pseudanabaena]MEA5488071.1 proton extrusion protein PcxA [Pseudanabaena sp. CCNP1317]WGS75204.1 proton extrusion protein PcxA [Pseudanabaena galeata CCNP1313]
MASVIAPNPEDQASQKAKQILNKLAVVDQVLARYKDSEISLLDSILDSHHLEESVVVSKSLDLDRDEKLAASTIPEPEILTNKPVPLLRSIFPSFTKYNRERRSNTEADVIKEFQLSRYRTKRALKFLAILIIIPLVTQQVAKNFIFSPIFSHFQAANLLEISLNSQLEREAIEEVEAFEKKIKFEINIGKTPNLSTEDVEKMVHQKSIEVARKSEHEGSNALQNIFADLLSAIVFAWILIAGKRSVEILKDFLDEKIYGLNESAKAFLIILFTDVFVGFHSSHGWEVVMEGILRHLGIPENRDFIYLFIATFPVVLDSIFKYWIFCYLSRVSPSAVATYRNMNE